MDKHRKERHQYNGQNELQGRKIAVDEVQEYLI